MNPNPKKEKCVDPLMMGASPRSGGYITMPSTEQTFTEDDNTNTPCPCSTLPNESTSEAYTKLESDWESTDDYYQFENQGTNVGDFDQDSGVNVISNLISVVMILASGSRPPPLELNMAVQYLQYIKDDEGNTPPNAQGVLNHIKFLGLLK